MGIDSGQNLPPLSRLEKLRYTRHLSLPEISEEGQKKLKKSSLLVVGAGGLGSAILTYLASAGIGRMGIMDRDQVELSNLQRQSIHSSHNLDKSKTQSAQERVHDINPHVEIETHDVLFQSQNACDFVRRFDVIIDATDNFTSRYLINDACWLEGKPLVYASVAGFEGQISVFWKSPSLSSPCYRCIYPEPPEDANLSEGIFSVLPGVIGTLQAAEALKILLGIGQPLTGRMIYFNALTTAFREIQLPKNPECRLCGEHPTIHRLPASF